MALFSLKSEIEKFSDAKQKEWVSEIINHISLIVAGVDSSLFLLKSTGVENGLIVGTGKRQKPVILAEITFEDGTSSSPVIVNVVSPILREEERGLYLPDSNGSLRLLIRRAHMTYVDD